MGYFLTKRLRASLTNQDKRRLKSLGQGIRSVRERMKLSVYDVTGDDMPIKSRQHWQKIENGVKNINLTTLFKIAETLKVKIEVLFKEMEG